MRSLLHALHLYALLAAIVGVGLAMVDAVTRTAEPPAPAAGVPAPEHGGSGKVFLYLVDSLRYETAMDPSIMPTLARLRGEGAWAKVTPTREAVTVPCLRAAFTGRDRFTVFSFAENLWHRGGRGVSMFSQHAEAGGRACAWSDGSLKQFGHELAERHPIGQGSGDIEERQDAGTHMALDALRSGGCDLVIAHINYADRVAHQIGERHGIDHPEYRRAFRHVDDMIGRLVQGLGPGDTLVVMGDHGHDLKGRHLMGLDVPTFAIFHGPAYARGADLGTIPIQDTRALVSWGLGLPLSPDDHGGRHPEALASDGPLPEPYAEARDALDARIGAGIPPERSRAYLVAVLAVACLASLWMAVAWGGGRAVWRAAGAWAALLVALAGWHAIAGAVALSALLWPPAGARLRDVGAWSAVVLAALALAGWGVVLALARETIHYPRYWVLLCLWAPVVAAGAVAARRFGAMRVTWILLLVAGGLMYPTAYRYGAPATMVPVWGASIVFALAEDFRWSRRRLVLVAAIAFLIAPFALVNSVQFQFERWMVLGHELWGRRGIDHVPWPGLVLALVAKVAILRRPGSGRAVLITAVAMALALTAVEAGWLARLGAAGRVGPLPGALAILAGAWLAARAARVELARVLLVGGLLMLYVASVRLEPRAYLWLDCLLAALLFTGRFFAQVVRLRDPGGAYAYLLLLAVLVTGWTGLAWTVHRLEWGFLYEFIDPGFVETRSALFILGILARYLIPLVVARILLAEIFADREYPWRAVTLISGAKALSLLLIAWGIARHLVAGDVFGEALQQTAIWTLLSLALFWPPPVSAGGRTER